MRFVGTADLLIADLVPFPGNARRGDLAVIRASVRRHGQYRSIVVRRADDGTNVIVAGNHTARAMAEEGFGEIRADLIECDDDEARRINLADNRTAELGGYDDDALVELLSYLDGDYEGTGWTEKDVSALLEPGGSPDQGDASQDDLPVTWGVIVECDSESEQARLLADLDGQGWRVRALMT